MDRVFPRIPETISDEQILAIRQRNHSALEGKRGDKALIRLLGDIVVGRHEAAAIPRKRRIDEIDECLEWAQQTFNDTVEMDSEPEARITRAVGRLLMKSVVAVAKVEQAAGRKNLPGKTIKKFRDRSHDLMREALQASEDSLKLFASEDKDARKDAKLILSSKRAELNKLQAVLADTERGVAKDKKNQ